MATARRTPSSKRKPKADPDAPRALTRAERDEWNRLRKLREPVDEVVMTPAQRRAFLDLVHVDKAIGTVTALRQAGVAGTKAQLHAYVDADDELAAELKEARGYGHDRIRATISERAIDGWLEPVFHQGEIVGHIRRFSDRLLGMLAKAELPEYRDRVEHTGPGGGPLEVENLDVAAAIDRFNAILDRAIERAQPVGEVRALERAAADRAPRSAGG